MGKEDLKKNLSPIFAWSLVAVALTSGCKQGSDRSLGLFNGLQGRWVGPVVPEQPNCGATVEGTMSIGGQGFAFDPFQSSIVIAGKLDQDDHLAGKLLRHGTDRQDISILFEGSPQGSEMITGILRSGRCSWTVTLHRR